MMSVSMIENIEELESSKSETDVWWSQSIMSAATLQIYKVMNYTNLRNDSL